MKSRVDGYHFMSESRHTALPSLPKISVLNMLCTRRGRSDDQQLNVPTKEKSSRYQYGQLADSAHLVFSRFKETYWRAVFLDFVMFMLTPPVADGCRVVSCSKGVALAEISICYYPFSNFHVRPVQVITTPYVIRCKFLACSQRCFKLAVGFEFVPEES